MIDYIMQNPAELAAAFLCVAEFVTRMTKTKKDDGFVTRLGKAIDFTLSRLPNRVK